MRGLREHCICRLCLSTGCRLVDILEENCDVEFEVKRAVEDLLQLTVAKEELYPWMVCVICVEKLREFNLFKRCCVENQEVYDSRIKGIAFPRKEVSSPECGDIAVKLKDDGSNWNLLVQDSQGQAEDNPLEAPRSTMAHMADLDIPIKTEECIIEEDPLYHGSCDNIGCDYSTLPTTEDLDVDSKEEQQRRALRNPRNVARPSLPQQEQLQRERRARQRASAAAPSTAQRQGRRLLRDAERQRQRRARLTDSERELARRRNREQQRQRRARLRQEERAQQRLRNTEQRRRARARRKMQETRFLRTGDVHSAGVEPSDVEQDCAGSRVIRKDQEGLSQQNRLSRSLCSGAVKEETDAVANTVAASGMCGTSRSQTGATRRRPIRNGRVGRKRLSLGRRKLNQVLVCDEGGDQIGSEACQFTQVRGHQSGDIGTGPGKSGGQSLGEECGTDSKEVLATGVISGHQVRKKDSEFVCEQCGEVCAHKARLISHIRSTHAKVSARASVRREPTERRRERRFFCDPCGKGFHKKNELWRHVHSVHLGLKPFSCGICSKTFSTKMNMKTHVLVVHISERSIACEVCGKGFKRHDYLRNHMLTHLDVRPFPCPLCPRSFLFKSRLASHMDTHGGRSHACEVCSKEFKEAYLLRKHMRVHSDERPYKCEQCPRAFKRPGGLRNHSLVHSGLRKYSCDVCLKKFARNSHLRLHMRTHDGEKPYECQLCHKKFSLERNLKRHASRHEERKHECQTCHKLFSTKWDLRSHVTRHESVARPFECGECKKRFRLKDTLRAHVLRHSGLRPHVCGVCSKAFKTKSNLKTHLEVQGGELLRCGECGKTTKAKNCLKRHLKTFHGGDEEEGEGKETDGTEEKLNLDMV